MKTFSIKAKEIQRQWHLIDATDLVLGRLASIIAKLLRAKHKPSFTPHMDHGDCVVVINAEKVHLTGKKREEKPYYHHTGHPGGIKCKIAGDILKGPHGKRVIVKAVERMINGGSSPLGRAQMGHLYVYTGPEHLHAAQNPKALSVGLWNEKNCKREA